MEDVLDLSSRSTLSMVPEGKVNAQESMEERREQANQGANTR